ncbi:MAG: hypothetical protein ACE5MG_08350 [Candidatus Methylomirabilales bacterium]
MRRRSIRRFVAATALLCSISAQGCYTYRAHAPGYPGVAEGSEVVWSFAWGLAQELPTIDNCNNQALAEVTMRSNFAFALLTVVTLGFASPQKVEWKCARATPPPGEFRPATTEVE